MVLSSLLFISSVISSRLAVSESQKIVIANVTNRDAESNISHGQDIYEEMTRPLAKVGDIPYF